METPLDPPLNEKPKVGVLKCTFQRTSEASLIHKLESILSYGRVKAIVMENIIYAQL